MTDDKMTPEDEVLQVEDNDPEALAGEDVEYDFDAEDPDVTDDADAEVK